MAASGERLGEILAGAGFADYETFMHAALAAELATRAAQMRRRAPAAAGSAGTPLEAIGVGGTSINDFLDGLFGASLDGYMELTELNSQLATKSKFVMNLAEGLRLFALNALLASTRLGSDGIVLVAVAGIMRGPTDSIRGLIRELSGEVDGAAAFLREIGFRVSVAKLQSQMVSVFVDELLAEESDDAYDPDERSLRARDLTLLYRLPRRSAGAPVSHPRRSRSTSQRRRLRRHAASPRSEHDARARGQRPDRGSARARRRRSGPAVWRDPRTDHHRPDRAHGVRRRCSTRSRDRVKQHCDHGPRRPQNDARQRHSARRGLAP